MYRQMRAVVAAVALTASCALAQHSAYVVGSPDAGTTTVAADGAVQENWGQVRLVLEGAPAATCALSVDPVPTVTVSSSAGAVALTTEVFRAPVWPSGVDVLTARVRNTAESPRTAAVVLALPEGAEAGERTVAAGGRNVLALPASLTPKRKGRDWGWTAGGQALPGWAKPQGPGDPAFRSIRAGMGGVPITYLFAVPPRGGRKVVLGLCESHWAEAGQRPLLLNVEGVAPEQVDPVAAWGQHQPACLLFDGRDADGDGFLRVSVDPVEAAPDRNTILNVIWLFTPDKAIDTAEVLAGRLTAAAERSVDVGGQRDQSFYEGGDLRYELSLKPNEEVRFDLLLACSGGAVPSPEAAAWPAGALRKAAADLWRDFFAQAAKLSVPAPGRLTAYRCALARTVMARAQAEAFYYPVEAPGGAFSPVLASRAAYALDLAGLHLEAERLVRLYWDKPAPKPFQGLSQTDAGEWPVQTDWPDTQALALLTLGRHAVLSGDAGWARRAAPAVRAGAKWLIAKLEEGGEGSPLQTQGLRAAGQLLRLAGDDGVPVWAKVHALSETQQSQHSLLPRTYPDGAISLREALVADDGQTLTVLRGASENWLRSPGIVCEGLPTSFGPVSLQAALSGDTLRVSLQLPAGAAVQALTVHLPEVGGRRPDRATLQGKSAGIEDGSAVQMLNVGGKVVLEAKYP